MKHLPLPISLACLCLASTAQAAEWNSTTNKAPRTEPLTAAQLQAAQVKVPQLVKQPALSKLSSLPIRPQGSTLVREAGSVGGASATRLSRELKGSVGGTHTNANLTQVAPMATGTDSYGLRFTSSRVAPRVLDTSYPVRAVGKLYFQTGGAGYMCTASLIKPGVAVTAGHCVHDGSGSDAGFFSNFEFIPGYREQHGNITQPYGAWTNWTAVYTSSAWYKGGGLVPNQRDWALIVLDADASGKRVGDYTGWLGHAIGAANNYQTTVLGYPYNLSNGGQLQRVDTLNYDDMDVFEEELNNGIWGSDMLGGSSGGPVVTNWRVDYTDSEGGTTQENIGNQVVSVVSWGFTNPQYKVQGGSVFDASFRRMLRNVCKAHPGAC